MLAIHLADCSSGWDSKPSRLYLLSCPIAVWPDDGLEALALLDELELGGGPLLTRFEGERGGGEGVGLEVLDRHRAAL